MVSSAEKETGLTIQDDLQPNPLATIIQVINIATLSHSKVIDRTNAALLSNSSGTKFH